MESIKPSETHEAMGLAEDRRVKGQSVDLQRWTLWPGLVPFFRIRGNRFSWRCWFVGVGVGRGFACASQTNAAGRATSAAKLASGTSSDRWRRPIGRQEKSSGQSRSLTPVPRRRRLSKRSPNSQVNGKPRRHDGPRRCTGHSPVAPFHQLVASGQSRWKQKTSPIELQPFRFEQSLDRRESGGNAENSRSTRKSERIQIKHNQSEWGWKKYNYHGFQKENQRYCLIHLKRKEVGSGDSISRREYG